MALDVTQGNPRKRKADQALLQEDTNVQTSKIPGLDPTISPPKEMIEIMVEKSGEVIKKNMRRAWRTFNKDTARLGIVREPMNIQVMEDINVKTHFDELIDPTLVVIFDSAWETGFNLLNNVKNSMIDNF